MGPRGSPAGAGGGETRAPRTCKPRRCGGPGRPLEDPVNLGPPAPPPPRQSPGGGAGTREAEPFRLVGRGWGWADPGKLRGGRWCRNSGLGGGGREGFSVPAQPAVSAANMGQIEWAMWANEQALASGLSKFAVPRHRGGGRGRTGWAGDGDVGNQQPKAVGWSNWGTGTPGCCERRGGLETGRGSRVLRDQRLRAAGGEV